MIIGIDASNIRGGGGLTHLSQVLAEAEPQKHGIDRVVVWAPSPTLGSIQERAWIQKKTHPWLDKSLLWRQAWQRMEFPSLLRRESCQLVFAPGGIASACSVPVVTMSQNLLPFDWNEIRRFGLSPFLLKLLLIRMEQTAAFKSAEGVVFLTEYAKSAVIAQIGQTPIRSVVIPHGVDPRFRLPPRPRRSINDCTFKSPFSLLYVSHIWPYKHPWTVARAVAILRSEGMPVRLDFVGGGYPPSMRVLQETIRQLDPAGEFLSYSTDTPHDQVSAYYHQADLFVFASSCETFGQVLTEAMSAGLPIVCSDRAAMPEVLGDAGRYFDPENLQSLVTVLRDVIDSPQLRADMAARAYKRAMEYSWKRCAEDTLAFIAQVARECGSRKEGID
jgi:glycosyltransferase involved in cell wall biosynthesis